MKFYKITLLIAVLFFVNSISNGQGKLNDGWFKAGSKPGCYDIGKDEKTTYNNSPTYFLKSDSNVTGGFGTIMKGIDVNDYLGKRVKLTGYIKSENIDQWAGMWMRVDGKTDKMLGFDNMQKRPIKGATDFTKYEIVLDVPDSISLDIAYGVLISGNGQVWFPELTLEVVGMDVPTTNMLKE